MPVYRDKRDGRWRYRRMVVLPDGRRERISGTPDVSTKVAAQDAEEKHAARLKAAQPRKEVPTFGDWFEGRFWTEWVVAHQNKPAEQEAKRSIFKHHLGPAFSALPLDKIDVGKVNAFKAALRNREKPLSQKSINNILAVLSKALKYAVEAELLPHAPRVRLYKVERPEIEWWSFEEYARLLAAAEREGDAVYAAVCLAGEAGLRVGEVKALRWREDVDMVAHTITVNLQTRRGVTGTPKGRTRRTVPMTECLFQALKRMSVVREGLVIRDLPGEALTTENQCKNLMYRVCRLAGLPECGWHKLRHSLGTHAALFGVNPWRLQSWMGHKRIDETMLYVHTAEAHHRELPAEVLAAGEAERDPDRRVLAMLGARNPSRGNQVPTGGVLRGNLSTST